MILEGLVTTTNADGTPHLAPMGPRMGEYGDSFLLKPFPTSTTYANLKRHPEGVLHVTDDVLLMARAAVGKVVALPDHRDAETVRGFILEDACRHFEFQAVSFDELEARVRIECRIVKSGTGREFFGFNRAKHAVLEAAILATRFHLLPADEIDAEYHKLRIIVDKTAGPQERKAMAFLEREWAAYRSKEPR
jgi:uncharacterized protein